MKIPFGKHADEPLQTIPLQYLRWFAKWYAEDFDDPDEELLQAVRKELLRRNGRGQEKSPPPRRSLRLPAGITHEGCAAIVAAGRRTLAARYHPDKGGDLVTMQNVNVAADWLERHLREVFNNG